MKKLLLFVVLLFLISPVYANENVNVELYVLNLGKFDVATGAFTADFYLDMYCKDGCNTGNFEFMNGRSTSIDKIIDEPNQKFYRIQASLNSPVDLKDFPFDKQKMQVIIEDKQATTDEIQYVTKKETSGIDDSIAFTGWNIDGWDAKVSDHYYKVYDSTYSQFVFDINISRIALNAFIKTFLPVFFILLVVLFSFLLDPDKITNRLAIAGSSLVAAVMFHISISNQIPPVGYLTFADKFMLLTYFILLMSFVLNITLMELLEKKKVELVEKIHRRTEYTMFIVIPLLYVLLFILF